MKRKLIGVVLICCLVLVGCSTTLGAKKGAYVAKLSAEQSYKVIYNAYLDGVVSEEQKDNAAALYDEYELIQSVALVALTNSELDVAAQQVSAAQIIAAKLLDLLIQYELRQMEVGTNG